MQDILLARAQRYGIQLDFNLKSNFLKFYRENTIYNIHPFLNPPIWQELLVGLNMHLKSIQNTVFETVFENYLYTIITIISFKLI